MLTANREAFCQAITSGKNQSEAYKAAGYSENQLPATIHNHAYELMQDAEIVARITELRQTVTAGSAWNFQKAMTQIETNIENATADKQHGPARASTRDAMELSGLLEAKQPGTDVRITKVTVVLPAGFQVPEVKDTHGIPELTETIDVDGTVVDNDE